MTGPFHLEGYDVIAPLGTSGRCWRAVCLADGQPVVLRHWVAAGPMTAEVRRVAALWGSVPGGGVVRVRDVVCVGADLMIVADHAGGSGLDALLARRPRWRAGQVVTLVVGVGETLAEAHDRGLVHGRIGAASIVLDEDGRPLLTDPALAGTGEAAADVTALAALALDRLTEDVPAALVAALRGCVDAETQPSARALVDAVRATVPAESLLSSPPDEDEIDVVDTGDRGPHRRPVLTAAALAAVVATAAVVSVIRAGAHDSTRTSTVAPATASPVRSLDVVSVPSRVAAPVHDWVAVIRRLESRRLDALTNGDRLQLASVDVRDTTLWSRDLRVIAQVRARHATVDAATIAVRRVQVLSAQPTHVTVRVIDALSPRPVVLVLTRYDDKWLIRAVRRG